MEVNVVVDPRASFRNAINPYLRVLVLIGILLAMMAVITILATDDAEAWSTYNDPMERGVGYYTTQYYYSSSSSNYYKSYSYYYSYYYYGYNYANVGSSGSYTYWASMTYDTGSWNDQTYIDSAIFRYYAMVPSSSYSVTYDVYIVTQDLMTTDAQSSATLIRNGYYIGRQTVSSTTLTQFSITLSSGAENILRSAISNDEQYVYFGFYRYTGTGYARLYSYNYDYSPYTYQYAYLYLGYDASSPYTPSMTTLSPYTATSNPSLAWSAVNDRPTAPNRGYVRYTVGVFTSSSTAPAPHILVRLDLQHISHGLRPPGRYEVLRTCQGKGRLRFRDRMVQLYNNHHRPVTPTGPGGEAGTDLHFRVEQHRRMVRVR